MLNRTLVKKSLRESRGLLLACTLALFWICWTRVWLVSQFEMSRFRAIIEQFQEFERFFPVPLEQLLTYAGRIALTYEEPVIVVCMSVWAIARGSDCVSGELGRGTMELLLAQPVSRLQVLWSQAFVTLVGVGLLAAASWLGIYVGIRTTSVEEPAPTSNWTLPWIGIEIPNPLAKPEKVRVPLSERVEAAAFLPATCNLFALGVFGAGLSSLLSACDRHRWRTIGLMVGFYIVEITIKVIGLAAEHLQWLGRLTIFTAYDPARFVVEAVHRPPFAWSIAVYDPQGRLEGLGPLGFDLLLIGLGLAAYVAATFVFRARDLPAPL